VNVPITLISREFLYFVTVFILVYNDDTDFHILKHFAVFVMIITTPETRLKQNVVLGLEELTQTLKPGRCFVW